MKYILFDLDGTLTDPKQGIINCVRYALNTFGIDASDAELTSFIGPPLKEQFISFAHLTEAQADLAIEKYRERFAPVGIFENRIIEGVPEMLAALRREGKILALATSKPQPFAERIAEKYAIAPYLTALVGSELNGERTRKSAVIREALLRLGAAASDAVMVGDRSHDIVGAKEAGLTSVGVRFGYAAEGELEAAGADYIAATVPELTSLLLKIQ